MAVAPCLLREVPCASTPTQMTRSSPPVGVMRLAADAGATPSHQSRTLGPGSGSIRRSGRCLSFVSFVVGRRGTGTVVDGLVEHVADADDRSRTWVHRTRKRVWVKVHRGFKSHRHRSRSFVNVRCLGVRGRRHTRLRGSSADTRRAARLHLGGPRSQVPRPHLRGMAAASSFGPIDRAASSQSESHRVA
jgi:hypothetical protein